MLASCSRSRFENFNRYGELPHSQTSKALKIEKLPIKSVEHKRSKRLVGTFNWNRKIWACVCPNMEPLSGTFGPLCGTFVSNWWVPGPSPPLGFCHHVKFFVSFLFAATACSIMIRSKKAFCSSWRGAGRCANLNCTGYDQSVCCPTYVRRHTSQYDLHLQPTTNVISPPPPHPLNSIAPSPPSLQSTSSTKHHLCVRIAKTEEHRLGSR